jgi:adenylate cyclase
MTAAEFEGAGLYDPAAPNAADRLALLEWLGALGATIPQIVDAQRRGALHTLPGELALDAGRYLRLAEVAARAGVSAERIEQIRLSVGLPPVDPDEPRFSDEDAASFAGFAEPVRFFGEQAVRRFMRVIGSSFSRIAEAAVSLFEVNVEAPFREASATELALAQANLQAITMLRGTHRQLESVLMGHLETAIRRLRLAHPAQQGMRAFAIGFVDLVGFTPLSSQLSPRALADLVARFEDTAHDVVTARDGRVVKLIGDEVMFAAVDPGAACDIALTLVERLCCDSQATPRGGLAYGEVLLRGGDYYGPIVNLAARLAELAVPNELLVTPEVAAHVRLPGLRFDPAGKRLPKGFDAPVALLTVERSAS